MTIKNSNIYKYIINKNINKYLTNLQPKAPQLNVMIKTHKKNMPIRPVVNNTCAPSQKIAKFLNKKLKNMEILPNTYNTKKLPRYSTRNHKTAP